MLWPSSPSCSRSKRFLVQPLERHVSRWRPSRLELHIRHKSYRAASGGRLHVLGEVASLWPMERSPRWSALPVAARRRFCALSSDWIATLKAASAACAWQTRHGVSGAAAIALAHGGRERPACRAASERSRVDCAIRDARPRRASPSLSGRTVARPCPPGRVWRARLRSSPTCWCSTSPSSRLMPRWPSDCAPNWLNWSRAGRSRRCWSRTTSRRPSGSPTG